MNDNIKELLDDDIQEMVSPRITLGNPEFTNALLMQLIRDVREFHEICTLRNNAKALIECVRALEFYADKKNWDAINCNWAGIGEPGPAHDSGKLARKALRGLRND